MRIAVIGTGNIGRTLGRALAAAGHEVTFGSRRPDEAAPDGEVRVAGIAASLTSADVVLLALPAQAIGDFLAEHAAVIDAKLVIDATNRVGAPTANAAAAITAAAPRVRYVRAFNTLGWENFARPTFDGVAADLFYSAAESDRPIVEELISDVGLRPMYFGPDRQDLVDAMLPVWFALAQLRGDRHLAFRVLHD